MVLTSCLAVVAEFVDGVHVIVHYPDVLFRIVRIDGDEVRALEDLVPLRPLLDDVAVGVHDGEAMLPLGIHAARVPFKA